MVLRPTSSSNWALTSAGNQRANLLEGRRLTELKTVKSSKKRGVLGSKYDTSQVRGWVLYPTLEEGTTRCWRAKI